MDLSGFLLGSSDTAPGTAGDSGFVGLATSARASELSSGEAIVFLVRDWEAGSEAVSVSLLKRRLEMLDSPLCSLFNPMRPSFSTATKFVRTLESGLGFSAGGDVPKMSHKTGQKVSYKSTLDSIGGVYCRRLRSSRLLLC